MNTRTLFTFSAGALTASAIAFLVASGPEHDPRTHDPITADEVERMTSMAPEDVAAMMARISTPGEHHAKLAKTVGTWDAQASFNMTPDAPPTESTGTMTIEPVLGGRYFKGTFKMDFMGQPFEGIAYTGYDIAHEQYVSVWMDTMSTAITSTKGNHDEAGRLVMLGQSTTPIGDTPMKIVTTHHDDGSFVDEFYEEMPDGTWYHSGTITYTRR